ncbi:MAG: FkbM family methyltransferase, partial [Candidatus Omnitrophica bacterium]|nr:FkbM family methyltransferase [Candidatus Omnitrophota bacterium]
SIGEHERTVRSATLDECLSKDCTSNKIDLLKVDIEGSAADMFRGAKQTLKKIKYIFLEWHDDNERDGSVEFLQKAGFFIRKRYKRHIWFENHLKNELDKIKPQ